MLSKPMLVVFAVCLGVPAVVTVALLLVPLSPDGTNSPMVRQIAGVAVVAQWLGGIGLFAALCIWWGIHVRRYRHAAETSIADATTRPASMNRNEEAQAWRLAELGFRRLGELELHAPFDKPSRFWAHANGNGWIRADIVRGRGYVLFSSLWADGASLCTVSKAARTRSLSRYRRQGTGGVLEAYNVHVATAPLYGAGHGDVVPVLSMADVLAAEERERILVLPELLASQRFVLYMGLPAIIAVFGILLALARPV